jgi:SAM-dependent methyltransferase
MTLTIATATDPNTAIRAAVRFPATDPDIRMADVARQSGLEIEVATFETWEPAGREFDAVIAAQAWHWVDPVAGAAKAAQVLRAGGRLAVFWNAFEPPPDLRDAGLGAAVDAAGGSFTMRYITVTVTAARAAGA